MTGRSNLPLSFSSLVVADKILMNHEISIDISPLVNQHVGIGKSVAGLMSHLPEAAASVGILMKPYFRKMLGSLEQNGVDGMSLKRLYAPQAAEAWVKKLGLVERLSSAPLFHATDFYLPLRSSTPAISTVHDVIYATQSEGTGDQARIKKAMDSFVPQCVRVISCSEYSAKTFCDLYGYPMERVSVIGWGVDPTYAPAAAPRVWFATLFPGGLVQHHPQEHAAPHSGLFALCTQWRRIRPDARVDPAG